jgi:nitrous oxidase accessory protein NosD
MAISRLLILLVIMLVSLPSSVQAAVIARLPFTITKPGNYTLSRSLTYQGTSHAITVNASDVTIDLRGFTITSAGAVSLTNETAAIYAQDQRNITIRNGTLRGFFRGIYLEKSGAGNPENHLVEHIRAEDCTFLGIQVKGRGSVIRNNVVTNVGGATSFTGARYGITVSGDNLGVRPHANGSGTIAIGIELTGAPGSTVDRNRVANRGGFFTIYTFGLSVTNSERCVVEGNHFSTWGTAAIFGPDAQPTEHSVYRNNTQAGCDIALVTNSAVDDGGGNF